ncbi:helix-turn-helix transcriptional regulator [Streptomyces sp. SBC-4]|nr:helix-turn-helix transcriptional regulator [Streptomyces sp. SBC-4]MDV5145450.1 helix-turn-helix transcriptional regulator [Streptomyces sp. SBC-4]
MSARRFDRGLVRTVRRAAEISQSAVAEALEVGDSTVAGWETGQSTPDPEKLVGLAKVLGRDADDLFPRDGLPDLTDLRCDAGLYQYETADVIGTKSAGPVAGAERGVRRLKDKYVPSLAAAYGITEQELRRAEERSMKKAQEAEGAAEASPTSQAAVQAGPPGTLAEKITLLLERSFPSPGTAPDDAEIAAAVNAHAGAEVTTEQGIRDLRTGIESAASPVVLEGIAQFLGVTPLYFQPDDQVAQQVYEGLQLLAAHRKGKVGRVRARGAGAQGLPPNVLALVNELVTEMENKQQEPSE